MKLRVYRHLFCSSRSDLLHTNMCLTAARRVCEQLKPFQDAPHDPLACFQRTCLPVESSKQVSLEHPRTLLLLPSKPFVNMLLGTNPQSISGYLQQK